MLHAVALALALISVDPPAQTAELTVEVGPLRNMRGYLGCRLYAGPEGFPKEGKPAVSQQRSRPTGNYVTCTFRNLAPGKYAVSVLHDENEDGEMDTNFVGIPTEGYGASNNKLPSMSAPEFEDSSFMLGLGEKRKIQIKLKY